jgi:hypothetical protein
MTPKRRIVFRLVLVLTSFVIAAWFVLSARKPVRYSLFESGLAPTAETIESAVPSTTNPQATASAPELPKAPIANNRGNPPVLESPTPSKRDAEIQRLKQQADLVAQFASVPAEHLVDALLQHFQQAQQTKPAYSDFPGYSDALMHRLDSEAARLWEKERAGSAPARMLLFDLLFKCKRAPEHWKICNSQPVESIQSEFLAMTIRAIEQGDIYFSSTALAVNGYSVSYEDFEYASRFVAQTRVALERRLAQGDCVALDALGHSFKGWNGAIDLADPLLTYRYRFALSIAPHAAPFSRQHAQRSLEQFRLSIRPELLRAQEAVAKALVQRSFQTDNAVCAKSRDY